MRDSGTVDWEENNSAGALTVPRPQHVKPEYVAGMPREPSGECALGEGAATGDRSRSGGGQLGVAAGWTKWETRCSTKCWTKCPGSLGGAALPSLAKCTARVAREPSQGIDVAGFCDRGSVAGRERRDHSLGICCFIPRKPSRRRARTLVATGRSRWRGGAEDGPGWQERKTGQH